MEKSRCSNASPCYPEETGCTAEGYDPVTDCPFYHQSQKQKSDLEYKEEESEGEGFLKQAPKEKDLTEYTMRFRWTGNSMGTSNLSFLTQESSFIMIGIVGMPDSGKTSFLAAFYCLLRKGYRISEEYSFPLSFRYAFDLKNNLLEPFFELGGSFNSLRFYEGSRRQEAIVSGVVKTEEPLLIGGSEKLVDSSFSWLVGIGANYKITNRITFFSGVRINKGRGLLNTSSFTNTQLVLGVWF